MQIDLSDVISGIGADRTVSLIYDSDTIDAEGRSFPVIKKKPFELRLRNVDGRKLLISGETEVIIMHPCDRCLQDTEVTIPVSIETEVPLSDGKPVWDSPEDEAAFDEDHILDTDELIREFLYPQWPSKVLCREDCKGLCPVCGQNLNERECGCDRTVKDPRMARFQDVFNQMKEV